MNQRNQILASLLIVQIVLVVFVFWPRQTQAGGEPLFPDLTAADITSFSVSDGSQSIDLARSTGAWVLPGAGDYPADETRVNTLLDKIVALQTGRLVAQTPASHARLQVAADDFQRRITFQTAAGESHTVYLGTAPSGGASHFRVDSADEVYIVAGLSSFEASAQASGYIDTGYVSIPTSDVSAMTVRNASGELVFVKDDAGQWTLAGLPEGEVTDSNQVSVLVGRAAGLSMVRPLGTQPDPAWGMDEPAATVTLVTTPAEGEGQTYELAIGAADPDTGNYAVKFSGSPYYVRAAAFSVSDFVNKTAADFVLEPTPAPDAATPAP